MPESTGKKEEREPRHRRSPALQMPGNPFPVMAILGERPRLFVWILGIVIIGFAAAMSVRIKMAPLKKAHNSEETTVQHLRRLQTALEWFRFDCQRYPTAEEGLQALVANPGVPGWRGKYLRHLSTDVWGSDFQYVPGSNDTVRLFSIGRDGVIGTDDDIESPGVDYQELMIRLRDGRNPTNK